MRYIFLLALLVIIMILMYTPKQPAERFRQVSAPNKILTATPDEIQTMVLLTQQKVTEKLGKCTYCLEVSSVSIANDGYVARFIFSVMGGFPYGVGVDAYITKTTDGHFAVQSIVLQSIENIAQDDTSNEFISTQEFEKYNAPTNAELQSLVNNV